MRIFIVLVLFFTSLFAYKDAFFVGGYKSTQDGKLKENKYTLENGSFNNGFRFGWHNNTDHTNLSKSKYEFFYEKRTIDYKVDGISNEASGYHFGFDASWGYNLDLLLTYEIVPFVKLGAGAGKFGSIGNGTDATLGIGISLVTRWVEFTAEANREFWQLKGVRFPFETPFKNDGYVHNYRFGMNFRF